MQLSPHFSLEEMTLSETGVRHHADNTPDAEHLERLTRTCAKMEQVRDLLGAAISVSSGYRSPEVNALVGGAKNSAHVLGYAVDFNCRQVGPPLVVAKVLKEARQKGLLKYDQLIHEFGSWAHISFDPQARQQDLTIDHYGTRLGLLPIRV